MLSEEERRFSELCQMTAKFLRGLPPDRRDRMMQEHLAAARGPERNFDLMCRLTAGILALRRENADER